MNLWSLLIRLIVFLNKLKLNCYEIEDISYSSNNAYIYILCCHENENLLYVLREDN